MNLESKLDAIRQASLTRIPEEKRKIMGVANKRLLDAGVMNGIAKVGDPLPPFELENRAGEVVRSADLLGKGPLVVTVFRGSW